MELLNSERARGVGWALALGLAIQAGDAREAWSITTDGDEIAGVDRLHGGNLEHCDDAVAEQDFIEIFECGDELFEAVFNAVDGGGANVGDGGRFTRVPRADLSGFDEWASHQPSRATGPNAASCVSCHQGAEFGGSGDGAGPAAVNAIRDPESRAEPGRFIQRNTPHLFGLGALQRLAEEITVELRARFVAGVSQSCASGAPVDVVLTAKGVSFGRVVAGCDGVVDDADVEGVDADLLVRPLQWKGVEPSVRMFSRGAAHNELGIQPVEITGDGIDGDGDGVVDEMTIPDMTALTLYLAAQPRPVTELELNRLRLELAKLGAQSEIDRLELPVLSRDEIGEIVRGELLFTEIGCADCHRPALVISEPSFSEPSRVSGYRDDPFPAGQPPLPQTISFDLTRDLPDNQLAVGRRHFDLGNFERNRAGGAIVRLYGDLKRHDLGPQLAENIDETGHGATVWMTKELWGVGSTAQYLHDGRATTLTEAILEHGGEATASQAAFRALPERDEAAVVRFLDNLVLFFPEAVVVEAEAAPRDRSRRGHHRRR